jgi:hypothetical protein
VGARGDIIGLRLRDLWCGLSGLGNVGAVGGLGVLLAGARIGGGSIVDTGFGLLCFWLRLLGTKRY